MNRAHSGLKEIILMVMMKIAITMMIVRTMIVIGNKKHDKGKVQKIKRKKKTSKC